MARKKLTELEAAQIELQKLALEADRQKQKRQQVLDFVVRVVGLLSPAVLVLACWPAAESFAGKDTKVDLGFSLVLGGSALIYLIQILTTGAKSKKQSEDLMRLRQRALELEQKNEALLREAGKLGGSSK